MRTVLMLLAVIACGVAAVIGLGIVDFDGSTADAILRSVGWIGIGGALYAGSHLVGDWP